MTRQISFVVIGFIVFFVGFHMYTGIHNVYAQQSDQSEEILHPPYYGATSVNAVFDHEFPVYCFDFPDDCAELEILTAFPDCTKSSVITVTTQVLHYNGNHSETLSYSGHDGIDFGLNHDYVLAAHGGTVTEARWMNPQNRRVGLGLFIELHTADQVYRTRYGHMSTLLVKKDDTVDQQQVIGISGNTGDSTGPHLHFSVRANNIVVVTIQGSDQAREYCQKRQNPKQTKH